MGSTLYLQFKKSAELFPQNLCLKDQFYRLTYKEVETFVDSMAYHLFAKGVKAHDVVALYGDKSADCMIVFLALSKLGATCLTLDLAFPESMISYVLEDAQVNLVVCNKKFPTVTTLAVVSVDDMLDRVMYDSPTFSEDHLAWLVYSSGTTGKPKGVKISGRAMINSIHARAKFSDYQENDKVACNIYFYWEAFRPLFFGASLYVVSDKLLFDLNAYANFILKNNITETLWTPSFAEMLFSNLGIDELEKINALKRVWFNGEVVKSALGAQAIKLLPNVSCYNLYSISETFDVSAKLISGVSNSLSNECASIGIPLDGVSTWILNEAGKACQPGEVGELYLYSDFLADGYLNCPQAQKESFVHIDGDLATTLCYRTKDKAFKTIDNEIFILGRNDHVVKLRGYNVSLLSIENALKQSLPIRNCMVMLEGSQAVSQIVVAVIEPNAYEEFIEKYQIEHEIGLSQKLQSYLSSFLPAYSIPTKFIMRRSLSLDPYSAKLDRKKILNEYSDDKLVAIWQSILSLGITAVKPDTDFYDLGANSLQAIQLMQSVKRTFNFELTIEQLDKHSTLESLRTLITSKQSNKATSLLDYQNDLSFDLGRQPQKNAVSNLTQANNVLITGASGFLGAHWLEACLKNTTAQYLCLIRATDEAHGLARLVKAFKKYNLDASLLKNRVQIIVGCLTKPNLGLEQSAWQALSCDVDIILHAAAFVNLLYSYQKLKPSIVDGGKCMLNLATTHRLKPIVIISSDAIFPLEKRQNRDNFLDDDSINELTYGYAEAKWVQEKLLNKVFETYKVPFLLFRLGNLAPSTQGGVLNSDDANHHFCRAIKQHKKMPQMCLLEFAPVDLVVKYLIQKSMAGIDHSIVSLNDINTLGSAQIQTLMNHWHLEIISVSQWLVLLEKHEPELYALWNIKALFSEKICQTNIDNNFLKLSKQQIKQVLENLAMPVLRPIENEENL